CGLAVSFSCRNASSRASRSVVGGAADGMTWNVCRSPIHGLGSWLTVNASISGRLSALLPCWYWYSQLVEPASVIGTQKLNPCGTAVAGMLLPRENPPLEFVPRVVMT